MSGLRKSLVLLAATALSSFATSLTFTTTQTTIPGGAADFKVFDATLAQPTSPGGLWTLTIDLNYDGTVSGNTFEPFVGPGGGITPDYTVGDFLIEQTVGGITTDYGIPLSNHLSGADGSNYVPGNLYSLGGTVSFQSFTTGGKGFETSSEILAGPPVGLIDLGLSPGVPGFPVWLAPGGALDGTGTLTIKSNGGDGTTPMYTVTDKFSAPAGFLGTDDPFTVWVTSALCANGVVTGDGEFPPPASVPEPDTIVMTVSGLVLLGFAAYRRNAKGY
jgi:hypothetical protein